MRATEQPEQFAGSPKRSQLNAERTGPMTSRPMGIVLLAIIQLLTGMWDLLLSVALIDVAKGNAAEGLVNILGVAYLILGLSSLWLARGYAKGYERARRRGRLLASMALVFAVLGSILLPPRFAPDSPLWTIVFNLSILLYLGRPRVRAYFASRSKR
jgi:amino acid transporter